MSEIRALKDWLENKDCELKSWLLRHFGTTNKNKKARNWIFHEGIVDRLIIPEKPMEVTLARPLAPGFYRECEISTDENVDKQADGSFALGATVTGDSTPPKVLDSSTGKNVKFNVFGDGALGDHQVTITVDTKFGEAVVPMVLTVNYTVASAEATAFSDFKEAATDTAIPTTPPVEPPVEPPTDPASLAARRR